MAKFDIEQVFSYHPPVLDQPARYSSIRNAAKALAQNILDNAPPSREQSLALTHLQEAVMFANAAVATLYTNIAGVGDNPPAAPETPSIPGSAETAVA